MSAIYPLLVQKMLPMLQQMMLWNILKILCPIQENNIKGIMTMAEYHIGCGEHMKFLIYQNTTK